MAADGAPDNDGVAHVPRRPMMPRSVVVSVAVLAVAAVLALVGGLTAGTHGPPYADARGAVELASGPPLTAYPWAHQRDPSALDPWGFTERQCTSYVAWYLNSHGVPFARRTRGPAGVGHFDDANTWAAGARAAGFRVSRVPRVGTIAQWRSHELSPTTPPGRRAVCSPFRGRLSRSSGGGAAGVPRRRGAAGGVQRPDAPAGVPA